MTKKEQAKLINKCAKRVKEQLKIVNLLGDVEKQFQRILPIVFEVMDEEGSKL